MWSDYIYTVDIMKLRWLTGWKNTEMKTVFCANNPDFNSYAIRHVA